MQTYTEQFSGNAQTDAEQFSGNAPTADKQIARGEDESRQLMEILMEEEEPERCYSMLFCSDATGR